MLIDVAAQKGGIGVVALVVGLAGLMRLLRLALAIVNLTSIERAMAYPTTLRDQASKITAT
jgi:hypothetical protein